MKETKTKKLACNITGKVLFASKDYYDKKVTKAGTEEILHETYMCREARDLVKKGYSVEDIRSTLNIDSTLEFTMTDEQARLVIVDGSSMRVNMLDQQKLGVVKTDPDVQILLKNILELDQ